MKYSKKKNSVENDPVRAKGGKYATESEERKPMKTRDTRVQGGGGKPRGRNLFIRLFPISVMALVYRYLSFILKHHGPGGSRYYGDIQNHHGGPLGI